MIRTILKPLKINKAFCLIVAGLMAAAAVKAQDHDRDKYDTIASRYKNENAVYTNVAEQLVIKEVNGKLKASSNITLEKLFISDMSLNNENMDYFYYSDFHKLEDVNANAYLPSGRDYIKTPCNTFAVVRPRTYVFYDDERAQVVEYSGLMKNAITETKYTLVHTDPYLLEPFVFQDLAEDLPIVSATYEVIAPAYVHFNFVLKGDNTSWITQAKEEKFGNIIYRFTANDVPAMKKYKNAPDWRYFVPHVVPIITSYKLPDAKKPIEMLGNTDGLYKYDYKFVRNLNMKTDPELVKTVEEITKGDFRPIDKAAHIYKWVQTNIHYIAFEKGLEGFRPREADTVFGRKYGDCKDMSSILVAMCRIAGLDAYFTGIGTRSLPYTHEETPTEMVYNHMICALRIGDDWTFMDATDPTLPFGENSEAIQGKEAMIYLDATNYKIVTIPVEAATKNTIYDSTMLNLWGYKATGNATIRYTGHEAWYLDGFFKNNKIKEDRDKAVRRLTERGSNKYTLDKFYFMTTGDATGGEHNDFVLRTDFTLADYGEKTGKDYYVNMNLERGFENNLVKEPGRKVGYYYDYKQKITQVVVLNVPEGYDVKYIPKNAQGGNESILTYKITYTTDAKKLKDVKKITLTKEYELNTLCVSPRQFAENNKIIDDLKKQYKESVALVANNKLKKGKSAIGITKRSARF